MIKDINNIFSSIASKPYYKEVRQRYKINKVLSKILLPQHMYYVLYAFYRNDKLSIATQNHIGQNELNLQKLTLIKFLKQTKQYANIKSVSIFRDNKYIYSQSNSKKDKTYEIFIERSYGIFDNHFKDQKMQDKLEEIRNIIKHTVS